MKNKIINYLLSMSLFFPCAALPDTGEKVNSWFDGMNYSNVTSPGVYEGQTARYATLGGVSTRAPITRPFEFVSVQTPKFSAGCGGIDFYAGGFSAIDSDQFIDNLRAIGQNAQSLAYMLAIQIVSPQLSGVMEDVQTWANKYLNMNMDSCEAATAMVGGTMNLFGASEGNCTVKRMNDFGEDWTKANLACTTGGERRDTENSTGGPNTIDFVKGNLAWYVLMQDAFFSTDLQFAQVVLNITGTVILSNSGTNDDDPTSVRYIEPAITGTSGSERFDNIYTALLMGASADDSLLVYKCVGATSDRDGCLAMGNSLETISPTWTGLYNKIDNLVKSIVQNIYTDTPLTASEQGLIESTSVPLYRYLTATAAYFPTNSDVSRLTKDYTKLIAEDILIKALQGVIEVVEANSGNLSGGLSGSSTVSVYREDLRGVLDGLAKMREENNFDIEQYFVMQQRIQMYEKSLMSRLSSGMITSAQWGR